MTGAVVEGRSPEPPRPEDFDDAVRYLESLRANEVEPGLDRIAWLCGELGHPERSAPIIHVTGTDGKGSTSRLAAAVLSASGRRTGLYTSPHLERITERIAIDAEPLSNAEFTDLVGQLAPIWERARSVLPMPPTHFETLTALGFAAFARREIDALVLEVGVGGRFDATNVADGAVSVITNVALDHTEVLGPTRAMIATAKAGIVKPGAIVIVGEDDRVVRHAVDERCREVGATSWTIGSEFALEVDEPSEGGRRISVRTPHGRYDDLLVPFHGAHQARNAACALAALDAFLGAAPDIDLVARAWREVANPGRFEIVAGAPPVVIDVAHNPHGMRALLATLDEAFAGRDRVIVIGVNPHKDAEEMLAMLRPGSRAIVTTQVDDAPSVPASALAKTADALGWPVVRTVVDPRSAFEVAAQLATADDVIVCTGSHYWIGMARQQILARVPAPPN